MVLILKGDFFCSNSSLSISFISITSLTRQRSKVSYDMIRLINLSTSGSKSKQLRRFSRNIKLVARGVLNSWDIVEV